MVEGRHTSSVPAAAPCGCLDLRRRDTRHEHERCKHFHMLFVIRQHLADRLLARLGQIERHADRQAFAEFEVTAHRVRNALVAWIGPSAIVAAPPPTRPLMPWRSMNSIPRVLALTIGCQHSTGRLTGRGTRVSSLS